MKKRSLGCTEADSIFEEAMHWDSVSSSYSDNRLESRII